MGHDCTLKQGCSTDFVKCGKLGEPVSGDRRLATFHARYAGNGDAQKPGGIVLGHARSFPGFTKGLVDSHLGLGMVPLQSYIIRKSGKDLIAHVILRIICVQRKT